jgi:hypothetical protein
MNNPMSADLVFALHRAVEAINRVIELHREEDYACVHCEEDYPCQTISELKGEVYVHDVTPDASSRVITNLNEAIPFAKPKPTPRPPAANNKGQSYYQPKWPPDRHTEFK